MITTKAGLPRGCIQSNNFEIQVCMSNACPQLPTWVFKLTSEDFQVKQSFHVRSVRMFLVHIVILMKDLQVRDT